MFAIPAQNRETQLMLHSVAAALALAATHPVTYLDLGEITEQAPAARKAAVAERLRGAMVDLERVIRAKTSPPADVSAAVLGRRLVENGEVYDAGNRTYTPGPGFGTLLKALMVGADADAVDAPRTE